MQWHQTEEIVEALEEAYPDVEIEEISTTDLYDLILDLPEFSDDPDNAEETKLKRILEAWYDFRQES